MTEKQLNTLDLQKGALKPVTEITLNPSNIKYKTETELSKLVWSLKEKNKLFEIKWKILTKATPYRCGSRRCGLCITEKMHIALADNTCINKRDEFVSRCRHRHKYKLNCVK